MFIKPIALAVFKFSEFPICKKAKFDSQQNFHPSRVVGVLS